MKILANDGISKSGIDQLENAGFNVETEHVNQSDLVNHINENKIEVILVRSATEIRNDIIDHCPSLKLSEEVVLEWIILMLNMPKRKGY